MTDSGTVQLWDVTSPTKPSLRGVIKPTAGKAGALAFSPRGRMLLVGDSLGSVTAWDASDPRHPLRRGTSGRHTGTIKGLAYHRDGSLAASAGEDGGIRLWDVGNPARPLELTVLSGGGRFSSATVSFSPNGRILAAGSEDVVQLWDVDRTRILQHLCRDSAPITPSQWAQYLPGLNYDPPCAKALRTGRTCDSQHHEHRPDRGSHRRRARRSCLWFPAAGPAHLPALAHVLHHVGTAVEALAGHNEGGRRRTREPP